MSHDPNNNNCEKNRFFGNPEAYQKEPDCTCPPAADEVEQIRSIDILEEVTGMTVLDVIRHGLDNFPCTDNSEWYYSAALNLLRIVDRQRAELAMLTDNRDGCLKALQAEQTEVGSMSKRNIGSNFDDFLAEEGLLQEVTAVAVKRYIAFQLQQKMSEENLSKSVALDLSWLRH